MRQIGQILFIIAGGKRTIDPVQIVSKQTLEDLNGVTVQHMCKTLEGLTFSLEKQIKDSEISAVFESVEDAKNHLLQQASKIVEQMAINAQQKSTAFVRRAPSVQAPQEIQEKPAQQPANVSSEDDVKVVELPDGTRARIRLSESIKSHIDLPEALQ